MEELEVGKRKRKRSHPSPTAFGPLYWRLNNHAHSFSSCAFDSPWGPGVRSWGDGGRSTTSLLCFLLPHCMEGTYLPPLEYFTKPKKTLTEKAKTSNKTLYFGGTIAELPVF
jgi:hypothetical protein